MPNVDLELVETLTKDAEQGKSVSEILNQIPFQERLRIAKEMDALNETRRNSDSSLPDLQLTTENDGAGNEHLTDIRARTQINWWPDKVADVYDLPKSAQTNRFDYIYDTRMERDSQDSKHLVKPVENKSFYTGTGERK